MEAFCTAVASGVSAEKALRFANCVAGITVSKMGSQSSLLTLKEFIAAMKANRFNIASFEKLKKEDE